MLKKSKDKVENEWFKKYLPSFYNEPIMVAIREKDTTKIISIIAMLVTIALFVWLIGVLMGSSIG